MTLPLLAALLLAVAPSGEVAVERDIAYLEPGRTETLDAYLPPAPFARPLPALVLIHGGGWLNGDKAERRTAGIARELAARGIAVFSINYLLNEGGRDANKRLHLTRVAWPQSAADCRAAVDFVRREAERFGIDPARVGVMGCSAGGHLAMFVAATAPPGEVACVINFYGIHDLRGFRLTPLTGATPKATAQQIADASPVTHFTKDLPPFLIVHGTEDKVVPVEMSRKLAAELDRLGVANEYVELEGAPHAFDLQPEQQDLRPVVLEFLGKHLGAK